MRTATPIPATPVCTAVALENLRIMQEEDILSHVRNVAMPALHAALEKLAEHPLVGEASYCGMMGSLPLTPHVESRAAFASDRGTVARCAAITALPTTW